MTSKDASPTAWVIGVDPAGSLKVRCPHCDQVHFHGAGLGHRAPHCASARVNPAWSRTEYLLAISDALPVKTRAKVEKAIAEADRLYGHTMQ